MDPRPAISGVPFPPSVAAYNVPEIWPFSNDSRRPHFGQNPEMNHRDLSAEESTVTEQSESRGGQKRRDTAVATVSEDESSKLAAANGGRNDNDVMDSNGKRLKVDGSKRKNGFLKVEMETTSGNGNKPVEQNAQSSEAPKQDYIHVRARRGQATDSHSLAERARREKISERMKTLQDLVPGCNKVIGKASVLDEIINYIQSLQHQVEFLSMKLEAVNSQSIPSVEMFPAKDFGVQTIDTAGMAFASQSIREYVQGSHTEWLDMQTGGGFERPM